MVYIGEVAHHHFDDFSSSHAGHFSLADRAAISKLAAQKFAANLGDAKDISSAQSAWAQVVRDFHTTNHWGFVTHSKREKAPPQKPSGARIAAKYFWAFFSSIVIVKTAILFIGAEAAVNPDPKWQYLLYGGIAYSFINLFWFAYRAYQADEKQKRED
jgi:hypothetical protein